MLINPHCSFDTFNALPYDMFVSDNDYLADYICSAFASVHNGKVT